MSYEDLNKTCMQLSQSNQQRRYLICVSTTIPSLTSTILLLLFIPSVQLIVQLPSFGILNIYLPLVSLAVNVISLLLAVHTLPSPLLTSIALSFWTVLSLPVPQRLRGCSTI